MELRHLRYLVGVADASTFVKAAERLHVAQPSLSRQIRDLEQELEVDLLERGARGTSLTSVGEVCVVAARHILAEARAAADRARLSSRGRVGRVVLAVGKRAVLTPSLADILARASENHPSIRLDVAELAFHDQWDALRAAEADVGLGLPAPSDYPDLISETLAVDEYDQVVLAATHPLASRERLSAEDLRDETVVWPDVGFADSPARSILATLEGHGIRQEQVRWVSSHGSWMALVRAAQGVTFAPRVVVERLPMDLVAIPANAMRLTIPYSLLHRRGDDRPIVRTVLATIRAAHAPPGSRAAAADEPELRRGPRHDHFDLRHLRYFAAVVDNGSFGRAAEHLGITQPALSRQVRDLEHEVGVTLLDRDARGVTPTLAGQCFHADAVRILAQADRLMSEVRRARRTVEGRCVIGTVATPHAVRIVARTLRECAAAMPEVEIHVEDVMTPRQSSAIMEARMDLGIAHSRFGAGLEPGIMRARLADDLLDTALLAATHPLARRRAIDAGELAGTPFLFVRRAFWPELYDAVMAALRAAGLEPVIEGEYDGLQTLWALVAEGRGWHIGARSQRADPPPGIVGVPLTDVHLPWGIDLLQRTDEPLPLVRRVAAVLRRCGAQGEGLIAPSIVSRSAVERATLTGD